MTSESNIDMNLPIYEQAADWLIELREGEVDAPARGRLDTWFRTSPENIRAFLELCAIWDDSDDPDLDRAHSTDQLIALARGSSNVIALHAGTPLGDTSEIVPEVVETQPETLARQVSDEPLENEASGERIPLRGDISRDSRYRAHLSLWRGRRRSEWVAATLVACAVGSASLYLYAERNLTFTTDTGEQRFVKLVDGSTMELNSRSRVRIRFSDGERDVDLLEGQALFHVAKDPTRPFIVHSGSTLVRAVGTQFDVYRKASGTTVTVVEGRVAVLSPLLQAEHGGGPSGSALPLPSASSEPSAPALRPGNAQHVASTAPPLQKPEGSVPSDTALPGANAIFLSAGEQITVTSQSLPHSTHTDTAVATAWIQHELVFDSTSLSDVAQEFNRYNTRHIIIRDPALRDFHVTGIFSSADPASILRFLRAQHDIDVDETDDDIRISKK